MTPLVGAARTVQQLCERHEFDFCLIGGLAVLRWGEPRLTRDVDVTIMAGFGGEAAIVDVLLDELPARVEDARQFALANRVVLLRTPEGVAVDVALGAVPFEQRAIARATHGTFLGEVPLLTCSAEDLVVMKAFAGRAHDWVDIDGIVARSGRHLDVDLILEEARPLLAVAERPADLDRLRDVLVDGTR